MTSSTDLPIKDALNLQPTFGGGHTDAFLVKLNPAGAGYSDLVYSTYLGGSGDEIVVIPTPGSTSTFTAGGVVALDSCGNVHARIFGKVTINGSESYDFVVDVDDLGEPGIGSDKFGIQVSNDYSAGPATLSGGNIQIH